MGSWNSVHLEVLYNVLGWTAFASWSISFYPQVILNFRRKSVVGLNFDFLLLNLTKHASYLIYNASLFFSSAVQRQYRKKFGLDEMIPVAANDVAFSIHAVLLTAFTLFQRGNQKVSRPCIAIVSVAWLSAAICVFVALPRHSWLWLVSCFSTIQVVMTIIKYIPQAILNFQRKSTVGFSIGNILLRFPWRSNKLLSNGSAIHRSKFLGELLWKHRQDPDIFGVYLLRHSLYGPALHTIPFQEDGYFSHSQCGN
ncbi:Cystinosin-like protein [Forsythia ovata]|uniref:Cystinosin homolog n=1 Tax=Forsythia ovata TaxID=205694 RepID=A0ABD1UDY8_9LAMI